LNKPIKLYITYMLYIRKIKKLIDLLLEPKK